MKKSLSTIFLLYTLAHSAESHAPCHPPKGIRPAGSALSTTMIPKTLEQKAGDQKPLSTADLEQIKAEIKNDHAAFRISLQEEFEAKKWDFANTGLALLGLIAALGIPIGGAFLKLYTDKKDRELQATIDAMKKEHDQMSWRSLRRSAAFIYISLGRDTEKLYRYLDAPQIGQSETSLTSEQRLYKNYLNTACDLSEKAFSEASLLSTTFPSRKGGSMMPYDQAIYNSALHNYVFYLSSRNTPEDQEKVLAVLGSFKALVEQFDVDRRQEPEGAERIRKNDLYHSFYSTLVCAQLQLGSVPVSVAQNTIQTLLNTKKVNENAKEGLLLYVSRYNMLHGFVDENGEVTDKGIKVYIRKTFAEAFLPPVP